MSSTTVRSEKRVGSINGGLSKIEIVEGMKQTLDWYIVCVDKDWMSLNFGISWSEIMYSSVFSDAKIGKSMHSPQWSSSDSA